MSSNTEVFYALFDEDEGEFVGSRFLGTSFRQFGIPAREMVVFYENYSDRGVVRFNSPEAARNWLAPGGSYDSSNATLVRVTVEYTAEAV